MRIRDLLCMFGDEETGGEGERRRLSLLVIDHRERGEQHVNPLVLWCSEVLPLPLQDSRFMSWVGWCVEDQQERLRYQCNIAPRSCKCYSYLNSKVE